MPIFPVGGKPDKELLAALLLPGWLAMQASGTIKPESVAELLKRMTEALERQ